MLWAKPAATTTFSSHGRERLVGILSIKRLPVLLIGKLSTISHSSLRVCRRPSAKPTRVRTSRKRAAHSNAARVSIQITQSLESPAGGARRVAHAHRTRRIPHAHRARRVAHAH